MQNVVSRKRTAEPGPTWVGGTFAGLNSLGDAAAPLAKKLQSIRAMKRRAYLRTVSLAVPGFS